MTVQGRVFPFARAVHRENSKSIHPKSKKACLSITFHDLDFFALVCADQRHALVCRGGDGRFGRLGLWGRMLRAVLAPCASGWSRGLDRAHRPRGQRACSGRGDHRLRRRGVDFLSCQRAELPRPDCALRLRARAITTPQKTVDSFLGARQNSMLRLFGSRLRAGAVAAEGRTIQVNSRTREPRLAHAVRLSWVKEIT